MRAPRRQPLMTQHPPRSTCMATLTLQAKSQVCRRRVTTQCFSSEFQPLPALLAVGSPPEPIGSSATTESKYRVADTRARPSGPRLFLSASGAAHAVHIYGSRHQNWTDGVTVRSHLNIFVRLLSTLCAEHL